MFILAYTIFLLSLNKIKRRQDAKIYVISLLFKQVQSIKCKYLWLTEGH